MPAGETKSRLSCMVASGFVIKRMWQLGIVRTTYSSFARNQACPARAIDVSGGDRTSATSISGTVHTVFQSPRSGVVARSVKNLEGSALKYAQLAAATNTGAQAATTRMRTQPGRTSTQYQSVPAKT